MSSVLEAPAIKRAKRCPKTSSDKSVRKTFNNFVGGNLKDGSALPTFAQNLRNYFSEYCLASGIHGVRYLGESGRFVIEKLTWIIVITLMWYFGITLILKAYNKWVSSPVIVTFATTETGIFKIPFPAVTICPEVKSNPDIFNFTDVYLKKAFRRRVTPNENRFYESLSLVCTGLDGEIAEMKNQNINLTVTERAVDDIMDVFPFLSPPPSKLHWVGDEYEYDSTLSHTLTSQGVCYSFNMLDFDDILVEPGDYVRKLSIENQKSKMWTLEEGYSSEDKRDTFPLRTFMSGMSGGLELDIYTNYSHLDYLCQDSLQGFKVTLHHPSELPNMDRHFQLPLDQAVLVAIKPRMITTSDDLKAYNAKDRQCYFASERSLTFFKSYTQQNCLDECLSNYTLIECGCAAFYMPKFASSPICGPGSKECLKNSKAEYLMDQVDVKTNTTKHSHHSGCNCLPSCTSLEYDVEISQTDWNWKRGYEAFNRITGGRFQEGIDHKMDHLSKLAVYYREMQFLSSERNEVYGYLGFFSNTGGLLGLFIGFSVTSAIEILYFLTLRLVCNIKKFGRDFWLGQQNVPEN